MKLEILRFYTDEHGGKIQFSEAECEHSEKVRVQKISITSPCGCENDVLITHNGNEKTAREWGKEIGGDSTTVITRINAGWSIKNAVTKSVSEREGKECAQRLF